MSVQEDVLIDCRSLWKIFGAKAQAAMAAIKDRGLSKRDVLKEFGSVVGVADANFQVRRGEIFCIMGLSGSGKSTLIRMLNRLIVPTEGKVIVKGKDLSSLSSAQLREIRARHMGMVFQNVALLPHRTVLDNAAFSLEVQGMNKQARHPIAEAALEKVGLADWTKHYPGQLSGGMQQRVGLARALAPDPEIILMDEPFSALDPLIRRQLQDEFRDLTKTLGKSAVFITHDLDEAIRIGDRIAIMNDGAIIQIGTAEDIILNPADDYVEKFVANISRLHLITAQSVMISPDEYKARHSAAELDTLRTTPADADLDALIDLNVENSAEGIAVTDNGALIGVVTIESLLMGVKGTRIEAATTD